MADVYDAEALDESLTVQVIVRWVFVGLLESDWNVTERRTVS